MPYTFSTSLLSAQKTGTPNLIGTALSGRGVNIISLSTNDNGISFNAITPLLSTLTVTSVQGSLFNIDTAYHGKQLAVSKVTQANTRLYTVFIHNSAYAVTPLSALTLGVNDVSDANTRRLRLLGY